MTTTVINDSPYGNERAYNALRLAMALVRQGGTDLRIFLMGDAVVCGLAGQSTPQGYYNIERMLKGLAHRPPSRLAPPVWTIGASRTRTSPGASSREALRPSSLSGLPPATKSLCSSRDAPVP